MYDELDARLCSPGDLSAPRTCRLANPSRLALPPPYVVLGSGDGWWEGETDPGARGIDQFLANEEQLGQGLGSTMVRTFVDELFLDPAVTKVQTDPSPENQRAVRSYLRAGFLPQGEVTTPDGAAFLMLRYPSSSGSS